MDKILPALLGSASKAKLLRFFLSNPELVCTPDEIAKACKIRKNDLTKEVKTFLKIKLLKELSCTRECAAGRGKNKKTVKKKLKCISVNPNFPHLVALKNLILDIAPAQEKDIIKKIGATASLKLLLLSGIFLQNDDARADIFIVADRVKEKSLERAIADLEAHVGKEISYVLVSTEEFKYRLSMYDKLVRDILDSPYKILVNKLGDFWKELSMV